MRSFIGIHFFIYLHLFYSLNVINCDTKTKDLARLRESILQHEKELDSLHGAASNLVGETADALNFSKKRSVFSELNSLPNPGTPTTTIKMTLKFPNTAPVSINQGKLRDEIRNTANGKDDSIPSINPIPLVVIRPDALTNLLSSLSATVYQRKKIESKKIVQLEKLISTVEKKVMKRNIKNSIRELESELAFYKADKSIAEQKS
ncbi:signal peptide containing protein [Cryptosporidium canis]|uniref:Signal peptide containing protein n=1 Tax=Cryptosporidium canis TaxID=195482 RepID=A0A9D5HV93_9CRYT|nr:signal peptide containing protein [Cryptosporidium canis]